MSTWRYTAVELQSPASRRSGELAGETAAEVRASLRRIGLQVIDLHRVDRPLFRVSKARFLRPLVEVLDTYLRNRRRTVRAEIYDSLATMLESGTPLLEAIDTILASIEHPGGSRARRWFPSAVRSMLLQVRQRLRSGAAFAQAMVEHPAWFDVTEVAMVEAGQHSGNMAEVLRTLADRHERADALSHKLIGALAYPTIVACVGMAVTVFLSVKVLPDLAQILTDARLETPRLTRAVIAFGQFLASSWLVLLVGLLIVIVVGLLIRSIVIDRGLVMPPALRRMRPKVSRRIAVARVALQLAELVRVGVPVVEALRVLAPTTRHIALRNVLRGAADRVEQGKDLAAALADDLWFDAEFRRLVEIGEASGELDVLLERIGRRYERRSIRLIDRLATVLEPAVILALAGAIGIVVVAAVLPLVRLKEIL